MLNQVQLIGRVGRDPEMRYAPSGDAVVNFSIATSERWKDKNGDQQERTEWHRIVIWGKLAEIAGEYVKKGSQLFLQGKIATRKWEDSDGNERQTVEIVCDRMTMLGSRQDSGSQDSGSDSGSTSRQPPQQRQAAAKPKPAPADDFDDDIPF